MENEENVDLNEQIKGPIDDVTSVDIATQLSDCDDDEIKNVCRKLNAEKLASILEESELKTQLKIVDFTSNKKILEMFNYMSKDDIVDILGEIRPAKSKVLLNLMREGDKKIIKQLLGYRDDCAGGIMTTEYIALSSDLRIDAAIRKIKQIAPRTELIETIFVTNRKRELIGTASLRDILVAPEQETLEEITNTHFISVEPETDQEEVALLVSKYDLTAIPVVNKRNAILGIITIDDIVDVIVEEQTEDVLKMGGVAKEETLDSTLAESVRLRTPWLLINLVTAFIASMTVRAFESTIAQVVALSAVMSIVTGMGGNAGTQTISIIIRNIAMGKIKLKDAKGMLLKQIALGFIEGLIVGAITGCIVGLIYKNLYLGIIICLAIIGNLIIAGIFGLLIPLILDKIKMDPALSSSIFLTATTDTLGFLVFLGLAKLFLPHLI